MIYGPIFFVILLSWFLFLIKRIVVKNKSQVQAAHICSPRYSGGSWFQASPGKMFKRPYLKKPFTKIRLVEWLESPDFKP
jgi:hypothetical protein